MTLYLKTSGDKMKKSSTVTLAYLSGKSTYVTELWIKPSSSTPLFKINIYSTISNQALQDGESELLLRRLGKQHSS